MSKPGRKRKKQTNKDQKSMRKNKQTNKKQVTGCQMMIFERGLIIVKNGQWVAVFDEEVVADTWVVIVVDDGGHDNC